MALDINRPKKYYYDDYYKNDPNAYKYHYQPGQKPEIKNELTFYEQPTSRKNNKLTPNTTKNAAQPKLFAHDAPDGFGPQRVSRGEYLEQLQLANEK